MRNKKIHYNHEIESNILLCGALKEPEKLVWRSSEENLYSNEKRDVDCQKCLSKLLHIVENRNAP